MFQKGHSPFWEVWYLKKKEKEKKKKKKIKAVLGFISKTATIHTHAHTHTHNTHIPQYTRHTIHVHTPQYTHTPQNTHTDTHTTHTLCFVSGRRNFYGLFFSDTVLTVAVLGILISV